MLLTILCVAMPVSATSAQVEEASGDSRLSADEPMAAADFTILDLPIGISAHRARRILEERGYTLQDYATGPSWFSMVGKETRTSIEKAYRTTITASRFNGPNGEIIALDFEHTPRGPSLARSRLQLSDALAPEALQTQFEAKFGFSNCQWGWCHEGFAADDRKRSGLAVRLVADPKGRMILVDSAESFARLVEKSVSTAIKDCKASRLGVPVLPGFFVFAC